MPLGRTMVQSVLQPRQVVTKHSSARLTYDDYLQLPDDGLRHEIIEGEHYVSASPQTAHQRILLRLSYLIQSCLETHPIGEMLFAPFDVLLSEFNVLVPDLIFLSRERSHLLTSKNLQGAPNLVVEILSPSTASRDKRLKRDVYERTGVDEYWVVDPDLDVVDVYRRAGAVFADPVQVGREQTLTTPLLPTLEIPLAKVFE
jgi:Uma2 family endonuclease